MESMTQEEMDTIFTITDYRRIVEDLQERQSNAYKAAVRSVGGDENIPEYNVLNEENLNTAEWHRYNAITMRLGFLYKFWSAILQRTTLPLLLWEQIKEQEKI